MSYGFSIYLVGRGEVGDRSPVAYKVFFFPFVNELNDTIIYGERQSPKRKGFSPNREKRANKKVLEHLKKLVRESIRARAFLLMCSLSSA